MKQTARIAICGVITALAVLLMLSTAVFPFATIALPAIAGMLLCIIVIEINGKWAVLGYIAISIIGMMITPDREAAMLFVCFFGFYPILKSGLEKIRFRALEWIIKLSVFSVSIFVWYMIVMFILKMPGIIDEYTQYGQIFMIAMVVMAYFVFVLYDISLTLLISTYINWFKPKFLRR